MGLLPWLIELLPRRRIVPPVPGWPPFARTVTPVARALRISCVFRTGAFSSSCALMATIALPISFFRAWAAVPVTTTASRDTAASLSAKFTVTVWLAATVTVRLEAAKPRRCTRMTTVPASTPTIVYSPPELLRLPRRLPTTATCASSSGRPVLAAVTTPLIVPEPWPSRGVATSDAMLASAAK